MNEFSLREASFSNYFTESVSLREFTDIQLVVHEARFINYQKRTSLIHARIDFSGQQVQTESRLNSTLNPKWNQKFNFALPYQSGVLLHDQIEISVHDQQGLIGSTLLNLKELQQNTLNDWYCLFDKKLIAGSIRLTFTFEQKANNKIQNYLDRLANLNQILENKLKTQRITSPTVGSLQLMQQFLQGNKFKQHNNSNIISSEYQIGNEFEVQTIKGMINEIKLLQQKFKMLQQQKVRTFQDKTQKIKQKQKELNESASMIQQQQQQIAKQQKFLAELTSREQQQISKKDIILCKYRKKQNQLTLLKCKLNEFKYHDKRGSSLAIRTIKYEGRTRMNNSDFQPKSIN